MTYLFIVIDQRHHLDRYTNYYLDEDINNSSTVINYNDSSYRTR